MNYEIIYINDNGTAKVRMTIDGKVLEQDFPTTDKFEETVKYGMAVFQDELSKHTAPTEDLTARVGVVETVTELPTLKSEDIEV